MTAGDDSFFTDKSDSSLTGGQDLSEIPPPIFNPGPDFDSKAKPPKQPLPRRMVRWFLRLFYLGTIAALFAGVGLLIVIWSYGKTLPDYQQLKTYEPKITTRFYAGDGRILAEYANEKRFFIPMSAIPPELAEAFISAEDKNFYQHDGIDYRGIVRAMLQNVGNVLAGKRMEGASTITQQVAKNFLLSSERSMSRKIKEAILATRMERAFSKEHILELYLNEIYLGYSSYGVAAAALTYFDKSLNELTISECAFLAALPKAPNNYDPVKRPEAAKERRDYVLKRMLIDGKITQEAFNAAKAAPIRVSKQLDRKAIPYGEYYAEEVRREIISRYGEDSIYKGGFDVRTSINPTLQEAASRSLQKGLFNYDKAHGYRGPLVRIELEEDTDINAALDAVVKPPMVPASFEKALVTEVSGGGANIALKDGIAGFIPLENMKWARATLENQKLGPEITQASEVLSPGDIIYAEKDEHDFRHYSLRQIPNVEGALVALDPHTGRVLAMIGGFSFKKSQFNRATQAKRQPGSAFKPFVYLLALDKGYTPTSLILDAPFVLTQPDGTKWKPRNYTTTFYGPTTLRMGLERSRNLMTVRLAQAIGVKNIVTYAKRFGIYDNPQPYLSLSLGSTETTLLRLTSAYGMLVNGGKTISPTLVDRIQDRSGKTIFRHDKRVCQNCSDNDFSTPPVLSEDRQQVADPMSVYQISYILSGVIDRGTARKAGISGVPLAGKTGTSDDNVDAWFVGFSADLVVGVFVGFDEPRTLGDDDTGGAIAAPIFRDFMLTAIKETPPVPFRVPPGIKFVRVDEKTGKPVKTGQRDGVILEAFKAGTEAKEGEKPQAIIGGGSALVEEDDSGAPDMGGVY